MLLIPLAQVPNQALSFNADNALWSIHIYQGDSFMCADIFRNSVSLQRCVRAFGGIELLQYNYMTAPNYGNFMFDEDADWTNFGGSCKLYYLSQAELKEFNDAIRLKGLKGVSA